MKIRHYQESDFPNLNKLWLDSGVGSPARNDTAEAIQECLRIGGALFLLENENQIVGSAWITYDGRRFYLHHMAVSPKFQNKGLGKMLMDKVIDFAKEKKIQMKLEVNRHNARAIHLYEKYGFCNLREYDTYIVRDYK